MPGIIIIIIIMIIIIIIIIIIVTSDWLMHRLVKGMVDTTYVTYLG